MARAGGADYDFIFKLVLIGDSSVGKVSIPVDNADFDIYEQSNLLLRFTRNEFRLDTQSTIGVEFAYKQLVIDGKKIKTQVWVGTSMILVMPSCSTNIFPLTLQDTAGQERFKTVIPQFYRGSEGALAVFDLTKSESFEHIPNWIEEVHRHTPPDLPIVLVGNKSDLVDQRKVTQEQAMALAQKLNVSYLETSALNASNVEQAFTTVVTNIYHKKMPKSMDNSSSNNSAVDPPSTSSIPVSSDGSVEIGLKQKSFRLKDNQKPTAKKEGCC